MTALFFPSFFSLCLALLLNFSQTGQQVVGPLLPFFPAIVLGGGLFLAWRFNRSRLAYTLLLLAGAGLLIHLPEQKDVFQLAPWIPLLLPIALLTVQLLPERGLLTPGGLVRPALLILLLVSAAISNRLAPEGTTKILTGELFHWPSMPSILPSQAIILTLLACLGLSFFWCWRNSGPIETGLLATQLFCLPALFGPGNLQPVTWLGLAGLVPSLAIVEMSLQMAFRDDLTGLRGRRALNESLQRLGSRYCIAMLDIDHFKKFNDRHGHDVGDQVLRMVAGHLARVEGNGRAFRYGGEEFAILFPGREQQECLPWLESLRKGIESARFTTRRRYQRPRMKPSRPRPANKNNQQLKVTVSMGLAQRQRAMSPEVVLKQADKALYRAKKGGRNRVCV